MKERLGKAYILTHFFMLYGALFAFVVALIVGLSYRAVRSIEQETAEKLRILTEQTRDLIDAHLEQIDRILTRLERSPSIRAFLLMPPLKKGSPELSLVIDAFNELGEYRIRNDFVRAVYLFGAKSGVLISSDTVYLDFPLEYAHGMSYAEYQYHEFAAAFLERDARMAFSPAAPILAGKTRVPVVLCANSLGGTPERAKRNMALAAIDDNRLRELLSGLYGAQAGGAFLIDARGGILSAEGSAKAREAALSLDLSSGDFQKKTEFAREDWLVCVAHSRRFGLGIVSATHRSVFAARLHRLLRSAIGIGILFAVLAAIFAYIVAARGAKPLLDIAASTGLDPAHRPDPEAQSRGSSQEAFSGNDLVGSIKEGIRKLSHEKYDLRALIARRRPMLRQNILRDLLEGELQDEAAIAGALEDAGLGLPMQGGFAAGLATLRPPHRAEGDSPCSGYNAAKIKVLNFEEAIEKRWPEAAFVCGLGSQSVAVVFALGDKDYDDFLRELEEFHAALRSEKGVEAIMACGNHARGLPAIHASFRVARRLIDYMQDHPAGRHIFVNERRIPALPETPVYPLDMETKIMAAVKAGKIEALDATLAELVRGAAAPRSDDGADVPCRQLVHGLEGTLYRLRRGAVSPMASCQDKNEDVSDTARLETILAVLRALAMEKHRELQGGDEDLARRLDEYLSVRFADASLTLYMVARDFGKKESWLYDFFKKQMGETFSARLETIRLEKAKALLIQAECSVEEITTLAGYGNSHSFRRAFKRRCGVSPADFRAAALPGAECDAAAPRR